jgi:hypothetical protein
MNDLLFTQGQDNLGGLVDYVWICPTEDILSLPALAVASSLKTAVANIVNTTGKNFKRIYFTEGTAKVEVKSVGPRDGKARETMLTGSHPAFGTELEDFISDCQNTPCVIIYRLKKNGKLYLMGVSRLDKTSTVLSTAVKAYFESGDATSGGNSEDQTGAVLGWKFTTAHGPIEYAGVVPLNPGA